MGGSCSRAFGDGGNQLEAAADANPDDDEATAHYAALLAPLLGGSLPAAAAIYHSLTAPPCSSSTIAGTVLFDAVAFGIFLISISLMVCHLPCGIRARRVFTAISFAYVWIVVAAAAISLRPEREYRWVCAAPCFLCIILMLLVAAHRRW